MTRPTPCALALALALGTSPGHAQEGAAPANSPILDEVTVTGDWLGPPTKAQVKTYPGARTVVDEQDLHASGARTVEDALRLVPGVRTMDESAAGTLPNIGIRGLNPLRSQQALVLVDGIPAALAPYGQLGLSLFPITFESLAAIDVARGGVAVRYGPNNVGGVINFITRPIPREPGFTLKERLDLAGGNVLTDTYVRAGGFVRDNLGLQMQAEVIEGDTFREHSATSVRNLLFDADWFLNDDTELKGRLQWYDHEAELPGSLTPATYEADRDQSARPFDRFDGDTLRGSLVLTRAGEASEFNWTNFFHNSDRNFSFGFPLNAGTAAASVRAAPRHFEVFGSEPRLTWNFGGGVPQLLTVGARYVKEDVDDDFFSRDLATGATTQIDDWVFETDAVAAYASDTLSFQGGRLKITPGVRFEKIEQSWRNQVTGAAQDNDTEDVLPGLDVGWQARPEVFVFANAHRSLRPVQFTQITRGGDIGAERANNYELGLRLFPRTDVSTTATLFRIDFDNQIVFEPGERRFRNLGESRHQGVETSASWQVTRTLALNAAYTYLDAEQLAGANRGKDLPFASQDQFSLDGTYRRADWRFNLNGLYLSSAFSDAANTPAESSDGTVGPIPSYWLWNAQATYATKFGATPVEFGVGVNNLFDEDYYFRGVDFSFGRAPAPGRAVLLSVKLGI